MRWLCRSKIRAVTSRMKTEPSHQSSFHWSMLNTWFHQNYTINSSDIKAKFCCLLLSTVVAFIPADRRRNQVFIIQMNTDCYLRCRYKVTSWKMIACRNYHTHQLRFYSLWFSTVHPENRRLRSDVCEDNRNQRDADVPDQTVPRIQCLGWPDLSLRLQRRERGMLHPDYAAS
jgi:hypothetical protein